MITTIFSWIYMEHWSHSRICRYKSIVKICILASDLMNLKLFSFDTQMHNPSMATTKVRDKHSIFRFFGQPRSAHGNHTIREKHPLFFLILWSNQENVEIQQKDNTRVTYRQWESSMAPFQLNSMLVYLRIWLIKSTPPSKVKIPWNCIDTNNNDIIIYK